MAPRCPGPADLLGANRPRAAKARDLPLVLPVREDWSLRYDTLHALWTEHEDEPKHLIRVILG